VISLPRVQRETFESISLQQYQRKSVLSQNKQISRFTFSPNPIKLILLSNVVFLRYGNKQGTLSFYVAERNGYNVGMIHEGSLNAKEMFAREIK